MSKDSKFLEVCIVGGGFAGMNLARILAEKNINSEIYTSGIGASQFWVGTVDFLNYNKEDLKLSFTKFKANNPKHPYKRLEWDLINFSFRDFFSTFPNFKCFENNGDLSNQYVLTTLGNLKPCIGIWNTIFHNFDSLNEDSIVILVDFIEFNNSTMHLVEKSLKDNFPGKFFILELSFIKLVQDWDANEQISLFQGNLTEIKIADFFDNSLEKIEIIADYVKSEVVKQLKNVEQNKIVWYIFPPVLGIRKEQEIIKNLSKILNAECKELVAISPSIMSKRLNNEFENRLQESDIGINKNLILTSIKKISEKGNIVWELLFSDKKGNKETIKAKYVVFAIGTTFLEGIFSELSDLKRIFQGFSISLPNTFSDSFELIFNNISDQKSGIFACGSAIYLFVEGLTEEDEIKYGTGLGLSIATSAKVGEKILEYLK